MKNRRYALIAAAVLTTGAPASLPAQVVRGTVVDSASSQLLASVSIELLRPDSQVIERVTSDETGGFLLRAPEPGRYGVRAQRIGYRPFESALALSSGGETNLGISLVAVPVELAPVTVEAARNTYLQGRGYYMRKETERGTFMDPERVEELAPKARLATDFFLKIPGITIRDGSPTIRNCRNTHVYIDGVEFSEVRPGRTQDMMWALQPNDVLAIEVYKGPAQIPLVYGGTYSPCGVILVWTKH